MLPLCAPLLGVSNGIGKDINILTCVFCRVDFSLGLLSKRPSELQKKKILGVLAL